MAVQQGVLIGLVDSLEDPEGLARVRVTFPHLTGEPSNWARLALPMAGAGRGTFFRPEKGDEVLVACEHGDLRQPYIIGTVWSATDKPPDGTGGAADNNIRVIVSRSGHRVTLDDTPGAELIEIKHSSGQQTVTIDGSSITIAADGGQVTIKAAQGITVQAGTDLTLTAPTGNVVISGQQVLIN
jgi:uncharacterized protein involved in type VI secretion and phage assembly